MMFYNEQTSYRLHGRKTVNQPSQALQLFIDIVEKAQSRMSFFINILSIFSRGGQYGGLVLVYKRCEGMTRCFV